MCLHKHTQGHWSTVGITSDPWLGSHWAVLVCVFVSVSHPTGTVVCVHTQYGILWSCSSVYFCACGGFERRKKLKYTGQKNEREKSKQSGGKKKKRGGSDTDKNIFYPFLCLHPFLSRPHTVVSTMIRERWSQSVASQKTVSWQENREVRFG